MSDLLRQYAEENKILEIRSGSYLYGTNTPESDEDYLGIFMPPAECVFGLKSIKEVEFDIKAKGADGKNTADAVDRKLYEFRKFVNLALANNPNILEILFVNKENTIFENDIGGALLDIRHLFPSKLAVKKFTGYAHSQKHKMVIKRDNFNDLQYGYDVLGGYDSKTTMGQVYDFQKDNPVPLFTCKSIGFHIKCGDLNFEPGVYVKKARIMLKDRIDKATNRIELVLKYGYDTKFGSHLIRLLTEGITLLKEGGLTFPLYNADTLLDIKNGSMTIQEVLQYSDELEADLEEILKRSALPSTPSYKEVEAFVVKTMRQHLS